MMDMIEIEHQLFSAKVLLQGAQIIHFQWKNQQPLLWSTDASFYQEGKPFRGGIPICWPWFGKAQDPSHGFARINKWKLFYREDKQDSVYLEFILNSDMLKLSYWPYIFLLKLKMYLGKELALSLSIDSDVETTAALHSYFYTESIEQTSIHGLSHSFFDQLNQQNVIRESSSLKIDEQIDRIYQSTLLNVIQRPQDQIVIHHENASDVVVWNPWSEGSEKISDMKTQDYQHMICIETARINTPIKNETLSVMIQHKG